MSGEVDKPKKKPTKDELRSWAVFLFEQYEKSKHKQDLQQKKD